MHASTEDLLSVRDGEPVDAAVVAAVAGDAAHARELERLRQLQDALRQLPELVPPADAWERIAVAERETRYRSTAWLRRAAGIGIAAAVAATAILLVGLPTGSPRTGAAITAPPDGSDAITDATAARTTPLPTGAPTSLDAVPVLGGRVVPASYPALVRESARLERVLHQLPYQRPLMSGATASTIAGLEDRIALIDEQLTYSNARGVPQPQRAALWGERVELMNALVHVRYAQAQPAGF